MKFTRYEAETCRFGLQQLVDLEPMLPVPVGRNVKDMLQVLKDKLAIAERGNEFGCGWSESKQELVNTATAAAMLGITPRRVVQICADLDGQRCVCGSGWVFPRMQVVEYARMKGLC